MRKMILVMAMLAIGTAARGDYREKGESYYEIAVTDHGWRTPDVVAVRMINRDTGRRSVSFTFPHDPNNCDDAELGVLIEKHGGHIYEMGGYPGAPITAAFDVNSREEVDQKIIEMLNDLNRLIIKIRKGGRP